MTPLVSIIMPAYNASQFIGIAIDSVRNQTVADWELFVLDDCSTDGTPDVVRSRSAQDPRIHFIENPENMGAAKTRNRGLDRCTGKYIAFLDSDDVWHPTKLEKQLTRMEEAGAQLCYTSYALVNTAGEKAMPDYLVPETAGFRDLLKENVIGCSTVLLSADIMKQRRFCTDFYHEDYVLWLHLLQEGYIAAGCREVLVDWRHLENSRSYNKVKSMQNRWDIYRRNLNMPLIKSMYYLAHYVWAGLNKYRK